MCKREHVSDQVVNKDYLCLLRRPKYERNTRPEQTNLGSCCLRNRASLRNLNILDRSRLRTNKTIEVKEA